MTVTVASFKLAFPAFGDDMVFPDPTIQFWLTVAQQMHAADRWGNMLDTGVQLYLAHNLVLEAQAAQSAEAGGLPGQVRGPVTASSVDGVSYSRDAQSSADPGAGHWNLTTYGIRWKHLAGLMGAGPVHLGAPTGWDAMPGAWPGPFPTGN